MNMRLSVDETELICQTSSYQLARMKSIAINLFLRAMRETLQSLTVFHIKGTPLAAGAFDIAVGKIFTRPLLTHSQLTCSAPAEDDYVGNVPIVYGDPRMGGGLRSR